MKTKFFLCLMVLLVLPACGGGGGGGGGGARPESPSSGLSLQGTVNNNADIIDYVEDAVGPQVYAAASSEAEKLAIAQNVLASVELLNKSAAELGSLAGTDMDLEQKLEWALQLVKDALAPTGVSLSDLITYVAGKDFTTEVGQVVADTTPVSTKMSTIVFNEPLRYMLDSSDNLASVDFTTNINGNAQTISFNSSDFEKRADGLHASKLSVKSVSGYSVKTLDGRIFDGDFTTLAGIQAVRPDITSLDHPDVTYVESLREEISILLAGAGVGLSFTDFGYVQIAEYFNNDSKTTFTSIHPFVGGYSSKVVDMHNPSVLAQISGPLEFTGKVYGGVYHEPSSSNVHGLAELISGDAKLTFNPGAGPREVLELNFDNWYDVTFTGSSVTIAKGANYVAKDPLLTFSENPGTGSMTSIYYGEHTRRPPTEVSGQVSFQEANGPGTTSINAVYGAKR